MTEPEITDHAEACAFSCALRALSAFGPANGKKLLLIIATACKEAQSVAGEDGMRFVATEIESTADGLRDAKQRHVAASN